MSLFKKTIKSPEPVQPVNTAAADEQVNAERRKRAQSGGRAASFLWDAPPIATSAPKPTLFGG